MVLAYGSTERTKDVDAFVATRNEILAIELHDIIISKLGRYHAKDRSDIELVTRIPGFRSEHLTKLYELARADLKTYWPDKLEKTDANFNSVRTGILGLPPADWGDDDEFSPS